jgi:hypothetical protein|nr:hypothetical protein [Brevundimonas diminuta]
MGDDDFIELERTFHGLAPGDDDSEIVPGRRIGRSFTWSELLTEHRVVVLSEAGSGKTEEFRNVAKITREEGKAAFFLRLEFVADDFDTAFDEGTVAEFDAWLTSDADGWLFLDSVDEARLRNPKDLERAVRRLGQKLSVAMARAHILLSSRVEAWRSKSDLQMCERVLPFATPPAAKDRDGSAKSPFRVVTLDDLNDRQIEVFAHRRDVPDAKALVDAIQRADAWYFTARPQDLNEVIGFWKSNGRIGSKLELMAASIARRLKERDPNRAEARPIAADRVGLGAKLLAGAATLTRTQAVEVPDGGGGTSIAMATAPLLPDWTEADIATLLSRPVFDAETYGSVRFHHRTAREYLTAIWLNELLQRHTSRSRIEQIFFREQYGIEVIVPSMRPVLQWLVLFDDAIRTRVKRLSPQLFLEGGDPSQLPLSLRQEILDEICAELAKGGPRHLAYDYNAAQRFATTDLAPHIIDLIKRHAADEDVMWFLLQMVWQGELKAALTPALAIAVDAKVRPNVRIAAFRAIAAVGQPGDMESVRTRFAAEPGKRNRQLSAELLSGAPPTEHTAIWLISCIENAAALKAHTVDPLATTVQEFVRAAEPAALVAFIDRIRPLLARAPVVDRRHCEVSEQFGWLLKPAAFAIERLVLLRHAHAFSAAALDILYLLPRAEHFDRARSSGIALTLDKLVPAWPELNWTLFWHTAAQERSWLDAKKSERLTDCWPVICWSPYFQFGPDDLDAVLSQIDVRSDLDDKMIAISLAFRIYVAAGRPRPMRLRMNARVQAVPELKAQLAGLMKPAPAGPEQVRYRRMSAQWERRDAARKLKTETNRQEWRTHLAGNLDAVRGVGLAKPDNVTNAQYYLHGELRRLNGDNHNYSDSNWRSLEAEFGADVAKAYRDGVVDFARRQKPRLISEGAPPNTIPFAAILGLNGLAIESAESPDWPNGLDDEAAERAFRLAMHELNGFPPWMPRLFSHAPALVTRKALAEIDFELARACDGGSIYLLHDVNYSGQWLWDAIGPALLQRLSESDRGALENLRYVLNIIQGSNVPDAEIADVARRRVDGPDADRAATWFAIWVAVDPDHAIQALEDRLAAITDKTVRTRFAMIFISQLVGGRRTGGFWRRDQFKTPDTLKRLYLLMHACIQRKDDIDRAGKGVYSPELRDDAQDARDTLFRWLNEIPGKAAFVALSEIAKAHPDVESRVWFEHHARAKAQADSESDPWRVEQVREFHDTLERTPRTHRELYDLAVYRLLDLKADLEDGDSSEASVLRRALLETDVRNYIGNRLRRDSRGRYVATQEEELADAKRPDLRLQGMGFDGPVPMELKLADAWTGPSLFERLEVQLSGDYLRDVRSRRALFVLVHRGDERKARWQIPPSMDPVDFMGLIQALEAHWTRLAPQYPNVESIRIIGIDLTARDSAPNGGR